MSVSAEFVVTVLVGALGGVLTIVSAMLGWFLISLYARVAALEAAREEIRIHILEEIHKLQNMVSRLIDRTTAIEVRLDHMEGIGGDGPASHGSRGASNG